MKSTTKSVLILILTISLGILIGVLGHRAFMRSYFNQLHTLRADRGVERMLMRRIDPTNEQRPKVEKVLQKYGTQLDSMKLKHREQSRKIINTLMSELSPLLTEDQLERLRHAPPDRKRFIDDPPPPPPKHKPAPELSTRRFMSILQPDSAVSDTVRSIIEAHVAPTRGKDFLKYENTPDFIHNLRTKLEPYIPSGRLDTLELQMRPCRHNKKFHERPPHEQPRF